MTTTLRKKPHSGAFKFKVALAALKGDKTVAELCQEFGVVSSQVYKWKQSLAEHGSKIFDEAQPSEKEHENQISTLHKVIGKLKAENDFLEQVLGRSR